MENLKVSRLLSMALFGATIGCATSTYHVNSPNSLGTDILVSPDRVITQCEFIDNYTGDYKNPYGFMIHILDDQKTVSTVSNATVLEREECFKRRQASNKIIKQGKLIIVRGRGDIDSPRRTEEFSHRFPEHGVYFGNGRSLNFLAIWNDLGQCYDAFYGSEKPCPRHKF